MIDRTTRLRWRRRIRHSKNQVEDVGQLAEERLERHFFRRLGRLGNVRRFVASWVLLIVLLIGVTIVQLQGLSRYYRIDKPAPGGVFVEGILGAFTNANPIYATSPVDVSVARLVFSSLLKYDQQNQLVGDLAAKWQVNARGNQYVVTLKDNLYWHDGQPLTADDVLFTYKMVQNPDAKSPLLSSWQGIKISKQDERTITFKLPGSLSSFPYSLTNGIIPQHLLNNIEPTQLRSAPFNTVHPIGSGPFRWSTLQVQGSSQTDREERIGLAPFEAYYDGPPKVENYVIRAFHDEQHMLQVFGQKELTAMSGLDVLPDRLQRQSGIHEYGIPLTSEVCIFFKNSQPLLQNKEMRRALAQAVNQKEIVRGIGYPVLTAKSPLLSRDIGYSKQRDKVQLPYDLERANKALDALGWKRASNGMRYKDKKQLSFNLYSLDTPEYRYVASKVRDQFKVAGVNIDVRLQSNDDIQGTLAYHSYDMLLYGISLGVDPDVFAYWHSSQASLGAATHFNFSEYKSKVADDALAAGRTRFDKRLRNVKYQPFLTAWRAAAPAVVLYQPRFLFVTRGDVSNFSPTSINLAADRYANVNNWMIRTVSVPR